MSYRTAADTAYAPPDLIRARRNLGRRFTTRGAIAEQVPIRALCVNLRGTQALVLPVIPLNKIFVDFGDRAEACKGASGPRAFERAGEDSGERDVLFSLFFSPRACPSPSGVSGRFGPRFNWRHNRLKPYAQTLFGGGYGWSGANSNTQNAFALAVGGGLDYALTRHIAIKPVQVEYFRSQFDSARLGGATSNFGDHQNGVRLLRGNRGDVRRQVNVRERTVWQAF